MSEADHEEQSFSLTKFAQLNPVNSLKPESQKELYGYSKTVDIAAGEYLFRVGDANDRSMYLTSGTVALENAEGKLLRELESGSIPALHRVAHQIPRMVAARAMTDCEITSFPSDRLDILLTWDQTGRFEVGELTTTSESGDDWMTKLLQMQVFHKVPPANLQLLFMKMQQISAKSGDKIVEQGADGDYFYVINSGRCMVTRESASHQKPVRLAELTPGSCFGEDALLSDDKRNASVIMLTDGKLMRLAKEDFRALLDETLAATLTRDAMEKLVAGGAAVIDVRLPSEFQGGHIEGAVNIPLYMLRMKLDALPKTKPYVLSCDTGRRSAVAAFVLTQKGYDVHQLKPEVMPAAT